MNDEPPIITGTSSTRNFIEEGGPIELFDSTVTISDSDNLVEHSLIREIRVTLENPVVSEDLVIVNGSALANFSTTFVCDQNIEGMGCYEEFLRSLQYNNTNIEPGSFGIDRLFRIEVFDIGIMTS